MFDWDDQVHLILELSGRSRTEERERLDSEDNQTHLMFEYWHWSKEERLELIYMETKLT